MVTVALDLYHFSLDFLPFGWPSPQRPRKCPLSLPAGVCGGLTWAPLAVAVTARPPDEVGLDTWLAGRSDWLGTGGCQLLAADGLRSVRGERALARLAPAGATSPSRTGSCVPHCPWGLVRVLVTPTSAFGHPAESCWPDAYSALGFGFCSVPSGAVVLPSRRICGTPVGSGVNPMHLV